MSLFTPKPPWYAAGLAFECSQCGRCCAGPLEGYVWVDDEEIAAIAAELHISDALMRTRYIRRAARKTCLIEKPNHDCIFLSDGDGNGGSRGCMVYSVRPRQCRTWPFWPGNLINSDHWSMAADRCPGVNRGKVFPRDEIEARSKASGD